MLAITDDQWSKLLAALIPLIAAVTLWLQGYLKDRRIEKKAESAAQTAERAESKTDALHEELADAGTVTSAPPSKRTKPQV